MKFGVGLPNSLIMPDAHTVDVELLARLSKRADELGFDFLTAADHTFIPDYWKPVVGANFLDPFASLQFIGASTSHIGLFLACLVMPYRQPLTTAKLLATIDQLTGGRLILGVVPGYLQEEFAAFNLPVEERGRMTEEFVRIMKTVWTSDDASFAGDYYKFSGVDVTPKCAQQPHVPIWFGGSSKRSIRRAVELGSAWAPLSFEVTPAAYVQSHADELAGKVMPTSGTSPAELARGLRYARQVADELGKDLDLDVIAYPGQPKTNQSGDDPEQGRRQHVSDQAMIDWLGRFKDAGATGFTVHVPSRAVDEYLEGLEQVSTRIAPAVRGS